jgi:uncharacterized protein (TIGR02246 family)
MNEPGNEGEDPMRTLHRIVALTFVVTPFLLGPVSGANACATGQAEQEVRTLFQQFLQALARRDVVWLDRLWTDDYTFINPMGQLVTKKERLANLTSGATSLETIDHVSDVLVRFYGDTAVMTSRAAVVGHYSGQEGSGDYRGMTVWVKRDGRWQLAANQITLIAPAPGAVGGTPTQGKSP